ncbi:MAG: WD40 repeat domain-containing protein, partial [Verrucomicrobia bacterium]|nr:WD40 repeat domain-containing protein [Verrucomicrobiota bacterium]
MNVWETATGRPVWSLSVPGGLNLDGMVAIGPEGDQLAAGSNDGHIRLWDLRTGQLRWLPLALNGPGTAKAFSTGGNFLATASPSGEGRSYNVRVWSTASGLPVTTNLPHPELVRGVVFSPDARSIATAGCDGKVRLWEVPTGRLIRTLTVYPGEVDEVLFSKDGRHLLTPCKYDKTARLWDT